MPSIAQQDYKVIAPKEGRGFTGDAAAMGELKKAILNGIGFDCILKDMLSNDNSAGRVLGFDFEAGGCFAFDPRNEEILHIDLPYTPIQYQGLAAVQNAVDEAFGQVMVIIPELTDIGFGGEHCLAVNNPNCAICVDGKYLILVADDNDNLKALTIAETGPTEEFVNISWEDAQKLIGLPLV